MGSRPPRREDDSHGAESTSKDEYRASAELSESRPLKPASELKSTQRVTELKKNTERTRSQAARNRVGSPKAAESKAGAANVQAPRQPQPASAVKSVLHAANSSAQARVAERKRPRMVDRGSYINNLIATFGGGEE